MKRLDITKLDIDTKAFVKRTCLESDCEQLITEDTIVYLNDKPIILYKKLDRAFTEALRWAAKTIKYATSKRTAGLTSTSAIFGFSPRRKIFSDFCSVTAMASHFPKQHAVICSYASKVAEYYKEFFPDVYFHHKELTETEILPDWHLPGGIFTSGIVNKNNALSYHFDSGNFKGVLSNMIVLREKEVLGGHLLCPEYNIKFDCSDSTLVIFDGQAILHGVSPIYPKEAGATRYSMVYYALQQMCNCLCSKEEIKRVRVAKKNTEFKRLDPEHNKQLQEALKKAKKKQ